MINMPKRLPTPPLRITAKVVQPTKRHIELHKDLHRILQKYGDLPAVEVLGIASQLVGMMIAHLPPDLFSPGETTRIVGNNIEIGNAAMSALVLDAPIQGNA